MQMYRRLRYGRAYMRIRLTQNEYAFVDPEDYIALSHCRWQLKKTKQTGYAVRGISVGGVKKTIYMHREIMRPRGDLLIDHVNHNGLDNRKSNLRLATYAQNNWNSSKKKPRGSRFRGVKMQKGTKKWRAVICHNKKAMHLGYFDRDVDAARAYDKAAKKLRGDFAILNLP
ncbi:MAG: hypothetical protein K8R02_09650 [Anaerohalosphaeraceae bacterium]|nr:hypothetical protein [Anaerohalosphaeraceae bacterium]